MHLHHFEFPYPLPKLRLSRPVFHFAATDDPRRASSLLRELLVLTCRTAHGYRNVDPLNTMVPGNVPDRLKSKAQTRDHEGKPQYKA